MPGREDAYRLMTEHVKNENLRKHMLSVEAAMRFYAHKYGEDEELWAMTGLLHDADYEEYPDLHEHTQVLAGWLRDIPVRAVLIGVGVIVVLIIIALTTHG